MESMLDFHCRIENWALNRSALFLGSALRLIRGRIFVGYSFSSEIVRGVRLGTQPQTAIVRQAFLEMKFLDVLYRSGSDSVTETTIAPHYLYFNYPVWYVLA